MSSQGIYNGHGRGKYLQAELCLEAESPLDPTLTQQALNMYSYIQTPATKCGCVDVRCSYTDFLALLPPSSSSFACLRNRSFASEA